jgi:1L-myo-inositol 1-phosphate cytidylyltransferase / CDP-L-myo-inositol myo-inositolphosphotransferase
MAEAPQLPPDPHATLPPRAGAARPTSPLSQLPRVGVVLAAGSERLESVTRGGSKVLLRLGGLSLVEWAVRTLLARGLERVLVVVRHDAGPVVAVVGRLGRGRVRAVYADRWQDGNGASLAAVEGEVTGIGEALFALVTADHMFAEGALDRLLAAGEPAVLIDPVSDQSAWAEGTRVRVVDEAVVAFGKHLDEPAIDCGAFLLPLEVFDCQRQAAAEGDHTLAGAVTRLAQTRPLRAVPLPAGCWWRDVDTPEDAQAARMALRRSLAKDTDGPVSRLLNRPLSTRLSMVLAPLRPAPDLVSLVAFALGVAGAALLATGRGLAGALLVHAASVADGVDGEVARLQLRGGPRGALLDGVLDRVADAAILAGLGLWALDGHDARGVLALTVAATTGALLSMASKDRAATLGLPPAPERALGWLLGGRDGRLLLVAVGALLRAPLATLAAVTATSALSLGLRVAFLRRPSAA